MKSALVSEVRIGTPVPFGPNNASSAITKKAVLGKVWLSPLGIEGDVQADQEKHGGLDKALHQYCSGHYEHWKRVLPGTEDLSPGTFGENIVACDHDETNVCLGDSFQIGEAVVQVSQPRQPCWKLNVRISQPGFAKLVQSSGLTGWYYRVLQTGWVAAGDAITLIDRPNREWPLQRVHKTLYHAPLNFDLTSDLGSVRELSVSWKNLIRSRLKNRAVESWSSRLRD
ncbi:MOSC domain-containing protein [Salipiger thiooxidans]|jgi:MOSC domain-containing protein YiiM|uniref:MOSC domain-containing protein n=1 Tax=Arenibacterium halophilum TaxID=2583821 RepID=A0ABY2X0C1_9RHOB|nr:MOSC domain-containing protein [Arenibacterium halophilum]